MSPANAKEELDRATEEGRRSAKPARIACLDLCATEPLRNNQTDDGAKQCQRAGVRQ